MALTPTPILHFTGGGPEGGYRAAELPAAIPTLGDDFNWLARDYDAIRVAMVEELAARFPEHLRWTPADLEVTLLEVLAAALDQLSDMSDRVTAEAFLDSARRPQSVRRLLGLIGYDAATQAGLQDDPPMQAGALRKGDKLEQLWTRQPALMEQARRDGPLSTHTQRRMVTRADYTARLQEHPLVTRAAAVSKWSGSWNTVMAAVVLPWPGVRLDTALKDNPVYALDSDRRTAIAEFHLRHDLPCPDLAPDAATTCRAILTPYLQAWRMVGLEVLLLDPAPVGIELDLALEIGPGYFQSEVRRAVEAVLGNQAGGFFAPGRLGFGEDLHLSDIYQVLLDIEGVLRTSVLHFKRQGAQYAEHAADGLIALDGLELAVCDNLPGATSRGVWRVAFRGGRRG